MKKYTPQVGDIAEYTFDRIGETVTGEVVKVGKTYAEVQWQDARKERIRFARPDGVTFKGAEGIDENVDEY